MSAGRPDTGDTGSVPLTDEQRDRLEELLLKDRRRTVKALAKHNERFAKRVSADGDGFAFSLHLADQGTDAMERETAFMFASEEGRLLEAIDAALRTLYREPESFGRCQECGDVIDYARLEAVPHTPRCITCQLEEEKGR